MKELQKLIISDFYTKSGKAIEIQLSYQTFGKPLHTAPIVLVNHALTGNSNVTGINGWWDVIIGEDKPIDTNVFSVLAFNIPGNGFSGQKEEVAKYYREFTAQDIAQLFLQGIELLKIDNLFAVIGGSVGGGITWHMSFLKPKLIQHTIPVASNWKATDWLVANCFIQERILENSQDPIADARMHAMTFYRTPESLKEKFEGTLANDNSGRYNVETWLDYHGKKLSNRFQLSAYKMMNQILKTINVANTEKDFLNIANNIKGSIHIVCVNSDLLFDPNQDKKTFLALKTIKNNVTISEIESIHGHDAFLIEYQQLKKILHPIFQSEIKKK